jgi:hypothetical protein
MDRMNEIEAWNDEEAANRVAAMFQRELDACVAAAVKDYMAEGFLNIEADAELTRLDVCFTAADPLDAIEKRVPLDKLIENHLTVYFAGDTWFPDRAALLAFDFSDEPLLVRLQGALRCLTEPKGETP